MVNDKKKLLFSVSKKDLTIQTFRSGGKGGQHQNAVSSGVRIIHPPSGARGESRTKRSQHANKKLAFRRLAASKELRLWQTRMVWELWKGQTIDQLVEKSMSPENLKIEYGEGMTCKSK